jgi:DNA polymerase II small subunit
VSEVARRLAAMALERGYQLSAEALEALQGSENPLELLDRVLSWLESRGVRLSIIDKASIEGYVRSQLRVEESVEEEVPPLVVESPSYEDLRIEGTADEHRAYLLSRYQALRSVFELRGIQLQPARELIRLQGEGYVVGMVSRVSRRDSYFFVEVEDPVETWSVIFPTRDRGLAEKAEYILPDMVVVFRARSRRGVLVASDVILPDTSPRRNTWRGPDTNICVISDIHIGSVRHAGDRFNAFLDWLASGQGEAGRTRLLLINGDLVDGVYVYPGQARELSLKSYEEQYGAAAEALAKIPESVEVVYVPGNHEPCRKALPQPPIQQSYRRILGLKRGLFYAGNPAWVRVGGLRILAYHGQTLDDVIQAGTRFSYSTLHERSGELMEFILKARHLAPVMGVATPIMPLRTDYLAIPEPPDVLCLGHTHVAAYRTYKGVTLLNTGSWQNQTSIQESIGLEPSVGTAAIINLKTLSTRFIAF